ncbi:DUF7120 family protein [Halarchaeum nitratireducens]|uniref:CopG family transcriptional regulator n=1 Tax=Halarchaeum nitratireducens TaxID=489913 RepID=A0A830GE44_9EURY|nr:MULTISPECIES: cell surface protein [Halarchaeum]MBP2251741.1 Arc/MetJ-type ribon-helix-helix transcriptional regulator [Halarchaeum solikamskense]GGN22615.1 hypothetical protein GCM10009021_25210 [Halarchaeum nitratireducens]
MPTAEVDLPSDLEVEIDRLVDDGEFFNRKEAVEELLSTGLNVYDATSGSDEEAEMGEFEADMRETSERSLGDEYEF